MREETRRRTQRDDDQRRVNSRPSRHAVARGNRSAVPKNPSSDRCDNGCERGRDGEGKDRSSPLLPDLQGDPQFGHGARGGLERGASLNAHWQLTGYNDPWRRSTRCKMPFFPSMPSDASTKHIFTAHPEIYSHWAHVSEVILRGPSPLTPAQRELIGAYVSSLNSCQYCYGGHRAAA